MPRYIDDMATKTKTTYTNGNPLTLPQGVTPSKALVFVTTKDGTLRYHKATCGRIIKSAENPDPQYLEPVLDVLDRATRAMCCKPHINLVAPYKDAALEVYGQQIVAEQVAKTKATHTMHPTVPDTEVKEALAEVGKVLAAAKPSKGMSEHPAAPAKTFHSADHPEGYECRCCEQTLPVRSFPTTTGPEVRATRCRTCRDAGKK